MLPHCQVMDAVDQDALCIPTRSCGVRHGEPVLPEGIHGTCKLNWSLKDQFMHCLTRLYILTSCLSNPNCVSWLGVTLPVRLHKEIKRHCVCSLQSLAIL